MEKVKTRFAPSPTGYLHVGGARTALFSWLYARHCGGTFVLRIEDTDRERSTQPAIDAILESMQWLRLNWDEGPYYQTKRYDRYREVIDQLLAEGKAYKCYCSKERLENLRNEQKEKGLKPRYDGHCRDDHSEHSPDEPYVVRFRNPDTGVVAFDDMVKGHIEFQNSELDDFIIQRSDGSLTYNFCVVVDDYDMGITHVIRGDDHVNNTPRQINLYRALGVKEPVFGHVAMILGDDGNKLSKRHGAVSVMQYREEGYLPESLVNYLVRLGWSHGDQEIFSVPEMIELFTPEQINKSASSFNTKKLQWLNAHYMRSLPVSELARLVRPFAVEEGYGELSQERLEGLCTLFRERAKTLVELAKCFAPMLCKASELTYDEKAVAKNITPETRERLTRLAAVLEKTDPFEAEHLNEVFNGFVKDNNLTFKEIAPALRTALVGFMGGSHLHDIMAFLGREETLARIARAASL